MDLNKVQFYTQVLLFEVEFLNNLVNKKAPINYKSRGDFDY
jgi:hypothetical protein